MASWSRRAPALPRWLLRLLLGRGRFGFLGAAPAAGRLLRGVGRRRLGLAPRLRGLPLAGRLRLLRIKRLALARVIDQLDDRQLGVVAVAAAQADDARVAARPLGVTLAQLAEEALERGDARGARDLGLLAPAGRVLGAARVAGVEEACRLAAQVERLRGRVVAGQRARALRQGDGALDEGAQLLRLRHGRDDAL